jgi:hypothetical protein
MKNFARLRLEEQCIRALERGVENSVRRAFTSAKSFSAAGMW